MSWRDFSPLGPQTIDEEHVLALDGEAWVFRRAGKTTWARLGSSPFFELPRLTKLEGFFEEPELALANTDHIVASPPSIYFLTGTGALGIDDVTCGTYDLTWYDLAGERLWELPEQIVDGGEEVFAPPEPIEGRAALFLRRTSL